MIVSVKLRIWTSKKIEAIKNIRAAFGIGLVEAKKVVEAAIEDYTPIFINVNQFAQLYVLIDSTGEYSISDYKLITTPVINFDFTGSQPYGVEQPVIRSEPDWASADYAQREYEDCMASELERAPLFK